MIREMISKNIMNIGAAGRNIVYGRLFMILLAFLVWIVVHKFTLL